MRFTKVEGKPETPPAIYKIILLHLEVFAELAGAFARSVINNLMQPFGKHIEVSYAHLMKMALCLTGRSARNCRPSSLMKTCYLFIE